MSNGSHFPIVITAVNKADKVFSSVERGANSMSKVFDTVNDAISRLEKTATSLVTTLDKTADLIISLPQRIATVVTALVVFIGKLALVSNAIVILTGWMLSAAAGSAIMVAGIKKVSAAALMTTTAVSNMSKALLSYIAIGFNATLLNLQFLKTLPRLIFLFAKWTIVISGVLLALGLLVKFLKKVSDEAKKTAAFEKLTTAWSNLKISIDDFITSRAEFVGGSDAMEFVINAVAEALKVLAIMLQITDFALRSVTNLFVLLLDLVKGDEDALSNFAEKSSESFDKMAGKLENIIFNIKSTASSSEEVVRVFTEWERLVRSIGESFASEKRSDLLEFATLFKSPDTSAGFIEFIGVLGEADEGMNNLLSTFAVFFQKMRNDIRASGLDESALMKFLLDPSSLEEYEFDAVSKIFETLESGLGIEQFKLIGEVLDRFREGMSETLPEVFSWADAVTQAFSTVFNAVQNSVAGLISGQLTAAQAFKNIAASFIKSLGDMAAKKAMWEVAEGFSNIGKAAAAAPLNPAAAASYSAAAAVNFKSAAMFGVLATVATAASAFVGGSGGGGGGGGASTPFASSTNDRAREFSGPGGVSARSRNRTVNLTVEIQGNVIGNADFIEDLTREIAMRVGDGVSIGINA